MRGVAQEEGPSPPEMIRDPMVDPIRREPVHALDGDTHAAEQVGADVVPGEPVGGVRVVAYEADEARVSLALQREQQDELRLVQRSVQLPVHLRATRLDVRDVFHFD